MPGIDATTRRRLVLAGLLLASFALLTAYFREGEGGPLHSLQDTAGETAAPAQGVTQRLAEPFRDFADWVQDVGDARDERDRLREENERLRLEAAQRDTQERDVRELETLLGFRQGDYLANSLDGWRPVPARVIERAPSLYSSSVGIDQGRLDGIAVGDPVVTGPGWLVGQIARVSDSGAEVRLLNDNRSAVMSLVPARSATGVVQPSGGDRNTLVLGSVKKSTLVERGDRVVTSGQCAGRLGCSRFPRGLPIGVVSSVSQSELSLYKDVLVSPAADLGEFAYVMVLHREVPADGDQVTR